MTKHILNEYECGCKVVRESAGGFLIERCKLHEAAPELLEACKEMYWHLRSVNDPQPISDEVAGKAHMMQFCFDKLCLAIELADGNSPNNNTKGTEQ